MSPATVRSGHEAARDPSGPRHAAEDVKFSRRLVAMHIGALTALIVLVVASLLWVSDRYNTLARDAATQMVQAAVRTFAQKMEIVVRDYSIWDEAIVAIETRDTDWLYGSLGSAAAEIGTFDLLYLHDPVTGWRIGWEWGTPPEGTTGLLPDAILGALEARLAVTDPLNHAVVTGFAAFRGQIWGFAISRVVPKAELDPAAPESSYTRQVHGMILSEDRLATIGAAILMEDLHLVSEVVAGIDAVPLPGLTGAPIAYLAWTPPEPGARILRRMALPLGIGLLAMAAIALVSSRFAVRSARRLEAALADARAADRAKSEFLSNVSHELRTPMNGILGVVQLLGMTPLNDEQRELLGVLQSSADTQMALIGDLLDAIQLETGQRQLSQAPLVPADVAKSVVDLLRPVAEQKGLAMRFDCPPEAGRRVLGDARAIQQIATNLLGNAVKFTERGAVELRLAAEACGDAMVLSLTVRDTGPGIAEAQQARIFERFAQVDSDPLRRAVDGIGLGLAISQGLAQRMGGRIALHSEPGAGATFTFTVRLPLAEPAVAVVP